MKPSSDVMGWKRIIFENRPEPGSAPGTIRVDPEAPRSVVRMICYGPDRLEERDVDDPAAMEKAMGSWPVVWINVDGLGDLATIRRIGEIVGIHPLALEDVIHLDQRPKVDQYGEHLFLVLRMVSLGERIETEQISLFLGAGFVLTFQEKPGDCWDPIRERIRKAMGRIRKMGPDYLAYGLIDAVVDQYFPVLEEYVERAEALEDEVIASPSEGHVGRILGLKHELIAVRRDVWPMREMLLTLLREEMPHITEDTRVHLRDCFDQTHQIIEVLDGTREISSSLMDAYLSSVTKKTNDVMKVLTIIATIFIPLTFIVGIYGMNFDRQASPWNMPELGWYWGYPACLAAMAALTVLLLVYFRRKGWLGGKG